MPALSAYTERNNIFLKKKYHLKIYFGITENVIIFLMKRDLGFYYYFV